jgi:hypothetical protein
VKWRYTYDILCDKKISNKLKSKLSSHMQTHAYIIYIERFYKFYHLSFTTKIYNESNSVASNKKYIQTIL